MLNDGDVEFIDGLIKTGNENPERMRALPVRKCVLLADDGEDQRKVELTINPAAQRVKVGSFELKKCVWIGLYGAPARILRREDGIGFELVFDPLEVPPRFQKLVQNSKRVLQAAAA